MLAKTASREGLQQNTVLQWRVSCPEAREEEAWEVSFLCIIPALALLTVFPVCRYESSGGCWSAVVDHNIAGDKRVFVVQRIGT
jgi:hypothetical protein